MVFLSKQEFWILCMGNYDPGGQAGILGHLLDSPFCGNGTKTLFASWQKWGASFGLCVTTPGIHATE